MIFLWFLGKENILVAGSLFGCGFLLFFLSELSAYGGFLLNLLSRYCLFRFWGRYHSVYFLSHFLCLLCSRFSPEELSTVLMVWQAAFLRLFSPRTPVLHFSKTK